MFQQSIVFGYILICFVVKGRKERKRKGRKERGRTITSFFGGVGCCMLYSILCVLVNNSFFTIRVFPLIGINYSEFVLNVIRL